MKIVTLEVAGFGPALRAMRNPMNSWDKSDTDYMVSMGDDNWGCLTQVEVGPEDAQLSLRLQKAGPEHCKHLRMIQVWADIEAPLYWWKQMDCYRAGVEKVSCSTMHKLTSRLLTMDDFELDAQGDELYVFEKLVNYLNILIGNYKHEAVPERREKIWRNIIQQLPQNYVQKRTVMMSYAALRNIYRQREGHKLKEWETFREWVRSLPEHWMITEG